MSRVGFLGGMRIRAPVLLLVAALIPSAAPAEDRIGVVLMHGKGGMPEGRMMAPLISALTEAGFLVSMPEMPWSRDRRYDADYRQAMAEISKEVAALREKGAKKIVVAGQSQGANAALGFGALVGGVDGIAAIAPGHVPEYFATLGPVAEALAKAKELVAAGKGDEKGDYPDVNQGVDATVTATASVYLSHFDPDGPAVMYRNAAAIRPGIPLLWIYGERDRPNVRRGQDYAFDRAPAHPKNRYVVVGGGHGATPRIGAPDIVEWIRSLQ
jgi:predicted alpha/beta-hydrolase family hydrolase